MLQQRYIFSVMTMHIALGIIVISVILLLPSYVVSIDNISVHIRKCCNGGKLLASVEGKCNGDYKEENILTNITPLWRGLCYSTYDVCCSKELERQNCNAGRLAAINSLSCEEKATEQRSGTMVTMRMINYYSNGASYTDCCRSCQIGLAVKASGNDCNDTMFNDFINNVSYQICCLGEDDQQQHKHQKQQHELHANKRNYVNHETNDDNDGNDDDNDDEDDAEDGNDRMGKSNHYQTSPNNSNNNHFERIIAQNVLENVSISDDGTIILPANDDDICGKFNLCEQICENTKESYRCKCHTGYQLNDNMITCSPISNNDHRTSDDDDDDEEISDDSDDMEDDIHANRPRKIHQAMNSSDENLAARSSNAVRCPPGFQTDPGDLNRCMDIDECQLQLNDCTDDQECINEHGSYLCKDIPHRSKEVCPIGFHYNSQTKKCDIKNPYRFGHPEHHHSSPHENNLKDKFSSKNTCRSGFRSYHGLCVDIDECLLDENACDSNQICINDIGDYHCDCKIGFNLDTTTNACVDINECSVNNHNCLPTQRCDNTIGSYRCTRLQSCGTGYTLNADSETCDDNDECALQTHNCQEGYYCHNTKGSFRCYRHIQTRFRLTTPTTTTTATAQATITNLTSETTIVSNSPRVDVTNVSKADSFTHHNNSHLPHHHYRYDGTPPIQQYMPTALALSPSTQLPCDPGFTRNQLGACVDINECLQYKSCDNHQRCINTNGSYRCLDRLICRPGFRLNDEGNMCEDIDECSTGEHNCAHNQICTNRHGSFVCSCPIGYTLERIHPETTNNMNDSSITHQCVDINECEYSNKRGNSTRKRSSSTLCPINSQCINTIGSYQCECQTGFYKSTENARLCLDIDECNDIPGLCQQKCVNNYGSYRCTCHSGYELGADNRTCIDVNECEMQYNYRLCMGYCNNVPGSYDCSCPRGYTLDIDRHTCRDIDECSSGKFCTGRYDVCTNTRGGYKCVSIHCPPGYTNDPGQKTRCQISSMCEGDECYNKPSTYTYNFISLVSKLLLPPEGRVIFNLRGPQWYDNIEFNFLIKKIQAPNAVEKATYNHFGTQKNGHEIYLSLKRPLEGPQEIELELTMSVFTRGLLRGKSVARLFIFVSQYSF